MMMAGKSKVKLIIVMVILVLVGVLGVLGIGTIRTYLSGAAAGVEPKGVAVSTEDRQATIKWNSDKASVGVVEYGTSPASLLLRAPEADSSTTHSVALTTLKPGLSYYFRIRVGDEIYDNNGIPYSFKTKEDAGGGEEGNAPMVTSAPAIKPTSAAPVGDSSCPFGSDYDGNGTINAYDVVYCKKNGSSSQQTTTTGECKANIDYDGNGTINSFDMVKCLQNKGQ